MACYFELSNRERLRMMESSGIDWLYRYRPFDSSHFTLELEALENRKIWMQNMSGLNDIREGSISEHVWDMADQMLKKYRDSYGCFSMTTIEPQSENARDMWDHYASDGFCLAYSMRELAENKIYMIPVNYVHKLDYIFLKNNHQHPECIFCTKENEWEAESEWRHVDFLSQYGSGEYYKKSIIPVKAFITKKILNNQNYNRLEKLLEEMQTEIVYM